MSVDEGSLEWTGERFIPGYGGERLALEHLHRYAVGRALAAGRRVLDLGCGEGYGTCELQQGGADLVVSVEIDFEAALHASHRADDPPALVAVADAMRLPLRSHSFDLVVCFEVIEHVPNPRALVAEVKRVLVPGGIFVTSTPNKSIYNVGREPNPYHVSEMELEEFASLLSEHFVHTEMSAQQVVASSTMWPIGVVEKMVGTFFAPALPPPEYVVAVCSDTEAVPKISPSAFSLWTAVESAEQLAAYKVALLGASEREQAAAEQLASYAAQLRERDEALRAADVREQVARDEVSTVHALMLETAAALQAADEREKQTRERLELVQAKLDEARK